MFRQQFTLARTAAGAMMALALTLTPAYAGHGGGGGGHGGGGGGYHGGGYGGGGGYHGGGYGGGYEHGGYGYGNYGRGGYYGGFAPGYFGGYGSGYDRGYYGGNYGYSSSANYYNPPVVQYAQPTLNVISPSNDDENAADSRAHITVQVPHADAVVFFDGDETSQKGMDRTFASPPLPEGHSFHYTIEARWMEDGKEVKKTRTITVKAGAGATVIF